MVYSLEKVLIEALQKIVGVNNVLVEENRVQDYLKDETADIVRPHPEKNVIVVKPADTKEVSEVLRIASQNKICVFPRGGGTNLVGGAVPVKAGIVLSLERMNKIEIDKDNLMAAVDAGVTLEKLVSEVENANLSFPLHP
jgi:glycolate oxidase